MKTTDEKRFPGQVFEMEPPKAVLPDEPAARLAIVQQYVDDGFLSEDQLARIMGSGDIEIDPEVKRLIDEEDAAGPFPPDEP